MFFYGVKIQRKKKIKEITICFIATLSLLEVYGNERNFCIFDKLLSVLTPFCCPETNMERQTDRETQRDTESLQPINSCFLYKQPLLKLKLKSLNFT